MNIHEMNETILLIGNGGRENAILDNLVLSKHVKHILVCNNSYWDKPYHIKPEYSKVKNHILEKESIESYISFAKKHDVGMVVVGPEKYLADGIVDEFSKHEILCFGPTQTMAQIECSKQYGKEIMNQLNLPTADYRVFADRESSKKFLQENINEGYQIIKKDGLASGKGVMVLKDEHINSLKKGLTYLDDVYKSDENANILIEKKLPGVEVSVLAFCNGKRAYLMPPARDFKRIYDDDEGPNTGGMGAICPGDLLDDLQLQQVQLYMDNVVLNLGYKGVLYAGLMVNYKNKEEYGCNKIISEMNFLEFNCRFGDPETQSILPLLDSSCDLYKIMCDCMLGNSLDNMISWKKNMKSINVVMSHMDYPYSKLERPVPIRFGDGLKRMLSWNEHLHMNMANVKYIKDESNLENYVTTGGRVLSFVVCDTNFVKAYRAVYSLCRRLIYQNMYYRMDIGKKYIIGDNYDYRKHHWTNFDVLNIPTIAIFQGENNNITKSLLNIASQCKSTVGKGKIVLLICREFDQELLKFADYLMVPSLVLSRKYDYQNLIDILRSYNIDTVVSDNYSKYPNELISTLFKEYNTNLLLLENDIHDFMKGRRKISRLLCSIIRYYNPNIQYTHHCLQKINIDKYSNEDISVNSMNHNISSYTSRCFLEYLNIYNQRPFNYSVDIDGGNHFVEYLKTDNEEIGDFCYKCPMGSGTYGLATDGVGTKLDLALKYNMTDDIGIDLVAMSVNDLYVHGMEAVYFLDYLAIDKMDIDLCKKLVDSIKVGCKEARCDLVGGETAEMKGMYRNGKCDLGGFAVGRCIDGGINGIDMRRNNIEPGCLLFGLPSNGIHSNGFTLVNTLQRQCALTGELDKKYSLMSISQVRKMLTPTRIYREIPEMLKNPELRDNILGIAHITGGGFPDNVHRVLCRSEYKRDNGVSPLTYKLAFELDDMFSYLIKHDASNNNSLILHESISLFKWIHKMSRCSMERMFRTFNCGIGMVFIMKKDVDIELFRKHGYGDFIPLGEVVERT
jgi:phosphoribosylamine--glycine ligase/phosphoribosylaminoimidazole synthetase